MYVRAAVAVHPDADALRVATRAGLTLAIPLILLVSTGNVNLTLYPTFGAFAAVYGRGPAPSERIIIRLQAGAWLTACVTLGAAVATFPGRQWLIIPTTGLVAAIGTLLSQLLSWRPPGALFAVFAISACAAIPAPPARIPIAFTLASATVAIAILLDVPEYLRRRHLARQRSSGANPGSEADPAAGVRRHRPAFSDAGLSAVAVIAAGILSTGMNGGHPYWAMVAAVAATAGSTTTARVARGLQRVLGTTVGLAVAAVILASNPSTGVIVGLAIAFQMSAELLVGRNYAVALVFVTPLAILMVELASPQRPGVLLRDRIWKRSSAHSAE